MWTVFLYMCNLRSHLLCFQRLSRNIKSGESGCECVDCLFSMLMSCWIYQFTRLDVLDCILTLCIDLKSLPLQSVIIHSPLDIWLADRPSTAVPLSSVSSSCLQILLDESIDHVCFFSSKIILKLNSPVNLTSIRFQKGRGVWFNASRRHETSWHDNVRLTYLEANDYIDLSLDSFWDVKVLKAFVKYIS